VQYRRIGTSGLKVSEIGLGCNNFGARADDKTSISIINYAMDMGINFLDTAYLYGDGKSEEVVGKAIQGKRPEVIIATKFGNPKSLGPSEQGGSRRHLLRAVEVSLGRLNTDYIDLYYLHFPDPATPIEETLRALDDLVHSGKVRYIGCSNFAAWQLCEAVWTSRLHNLETFIAVQSKYSMIERGIEQELVPFCQSYSISIIPWRPLANGFLTGKYRRGQAAPVGSRLANPRPFQRGYLTDANFDKLDLLESFAKERGHSVGELAIAWLLSYPWLGSVIAGAMNKDQLSANIAGAGWKLTAGDLSELRKVF
jgi:aryl-alcohol dehydrogenase-like predicted oxidoreductase